MQPSGVFGLNMELVHSTGNGSVATLGWIQGGMAGNQLLRREARKSNGQGLRNIHALNWMPPLERGVSWAGEASPGSLSLLQASSPWLELVCPVCGRSSFTNPLTGETDDEEPEEGVSEKMVGDVCCEEDE